MNQQKSMSAAGILTHIIRQNKKDCTYLIDGRIGPTGKTWLCEKLNSRGFKAYEVGEEMWSLYICRDNKKNRCEYLPGNVVIVILNEYLPEDIVRGRFKTNE